MIPGSFKNEILQRLAPEAIHRLHLESLELPTDFVIESPGEPVRRLIFLEDGVASMTAAFKSGFQVDVGVFGPESVIGAPAMNGTGIGFNQIAMQIPGQGHSCPLDLAVSQFSLAGRFHDLILQCQTNQLIETYHLVACNAQHEISQRLSRWLLQYADRSNSLSLALTQDRLARMLGVRRSSLSIEADRLKSKGVIQYRRGNLLITDRTGLELCACECYQVVKDHLRTSKSS